MRYTCRDCETTFTASHKTQRFCSKCLRSRMAKARMEQYDYQRTHVHVGPDGAKSIQLGTDCACREAS